MVKPVRKPRKGEIVTILSSNEGAFVVIDVHENPNDADLRLINAPHYTKTREKKTAVPWAVLVYLDDEDMNQRAARIIREATERD